MNEETKEVEIPTIFLERHENLYRLAHQTLNKWAEEGNRERLAYYAQFVEVLALLMVHESDIFREIARTIMAIREHSGAPEEELKMLGDMLHMIYSEAFQKLEDTPSH